MRVMQSPVAFLTFVASLTTFFAPPASSGKDDDWVGPLVLKVDGRDVKFEVVNSGFSAEDENDAVGFVLEGKRDVTLTGDFDLNGDGKADGSDKPKLDKDGKLDPKSLLNKRVLLHVTNPDDHGVAVQNRVTLPGVGECDVLAGSTVTVQNYRKTGKEIDRWSGTVSLVLRAKNGKTPLKVSGRFECGVRPD